MENIVMSVFEEKLKISGFIALFDEAIINTICDAFKEQGMVLEEDVDEEYGPYLKVTYRENEATLSISNMLMNIATADSDEESLRFDESLLDPDNCSEKICHVLSSIVDFFSKVLKSEDPRTVLEDAQKNPNEYGLEVACIGSSEQ